MIEMGVPVAAIRPMVEIMAEPTTHKGMMMPDQRLKNRNRKPTITKTMIFTRRRVSSPVALLHTSITTEPPEKVILKSSD
jgi:hypothetical protein